MKIIAFVLYKYVLSAMPLLTLLLFMAIKSNLVNSKSSELEFLFQIINSSNYREVNIKYITTTTDYYQAFSYQTYVLGA